MPIFQTTMVSIDIGHSNLKLLQTAADGRITKFVVHRIPEGCVEDLNIVFDDALIKSLKTARRKARLSTGKCSLVISGSEIIIRHFTLPILPEKELYQNILNEISGYLPVDPDKYYIDFKITENIQEDGVDMYIVLVTAVHKSIINKYTHVLHAAGFKLHVVDTCENAREKLLKFKHARDDSFSIDGGICILDFGTEHTKASIYHDGNFFVTNIIKRSGQNITDVIALKTGKDILTCETIKRETDFLNEPNKNTELKSAVTYEVDSLIYEVDRVLNYYRNNMKTPINAVYFSGGGSLLPGLDTYLKTHLGIPVYPASALMPSTNSNVTFDNRGFTFLLNAYAATLREEQ